MDLKYSSMSEAEGYSPEKIGNYYVDYNTNVIYDDGTLQTEEKTFRNSRPILFPMKAKTPKPDGKRRSRTDRQGQRKRGTKRRKFRYGKVS